MLAVIEGVARMVTTGEGVAGARITAVSGASEYEAITGADGSFRIGNVAPGSYRLRGAKDGLFVSNRGPRSVSVSGDSPAKAVVEFLHPAAISGRVTDEDRAPLKGVHVGLETFAASIVLETDAAGAFSFQGIEPGQYWLVARPAKIAFGTGFVHWDSSGVPKPKSTDGETRAWLPEYYPAGSERTQAEKIVARPGTSLGGLEIRLRSVSVFAYEGRVLDRRGDPVKARVMAHQQGAIFPEHAEETGRDGFFRLGGLREGEWVVAATALDGSAGGAAFERLVVSGRQRKPLELRLETPFSVEAVATQTNPSKRFALLLRPAVAPPEFRVRAAAGPDGRMELRNVHRGRYTVFAEFPMGFYAESVTMGGQQVLGQTVEFQPGAARLTVTFREGKSRISGTVEKGAGAAVIAIPADPALARIRGSRAADCDAAGRFSIEALAPGTYRILAFDVFPPGLGPDFEESLQGGTQVTVKEGESASVELPLTRWPLPVF